MAPAHRSQLAAAGTADEAIAAVLQAERDAAAAIQRAQDDAAALAEAARCQARAVGERCERRLRAVVAAFESERQRRTQALDAQAADPAGPPLASADQRAAVAAAVAAVALQLTAGPP